MRRSIPRSAGRRRAFTLLETAISSLLVGILIAASMQTVGSLYRQRALTADKLTGQLLADQLLAEIFELPYQDSDGSTTIGPESGEAGNRALFDDVDDYHNYSESPPKYRDGTSMTQWTGWTREVTVESIAANDSLLSTTITVGGIPVGLGLLNGGGSSDTGARKVTVTVRKSNTAIATAQGIRSSSWKPSGN